MLEGEQLWDTEVLNVALEHIKEGDTVIDAGAWIGGHTMAYAEKVGSDGDVTAMEPNYGAFECLKRNTKRFPQVTCMMTAVGDGFYVVPFSGKKGWMDSGYIGDDQKIFDVAVVPIDNMELAPNFIKIDVEGCELKVLKGAAKTIEKFRPIMVIEINEPALKRQGNTPQEVVLWIGRHNYGMNMIEECTGQDIYNILCIPR